MLSTGDTDIRYIASVLRALDELKRDALKAETAYFARLMASSRSLEAVIVGGSPDEAVEASSGARRRIRIRRLLEITTGITKALVLVPFLLSQVWWVLHARRRTGAQAPLVIALASSRLSLDEQETSAKKNLASLVRPMSQRMSDSLAEKVAAAPWIVVADALPVSRLWKYWRRCRRDDVVIADGAFLTVLGLLVLVSSLWKSGWKTWRSAGDFHRLLKKPSGAPVKGRLPQSICCSLAIAAWSTILPGSDGVEALFLTSNSTLTELLRAYLIQSPNTQSVTEVMHGIGSLQAERFFAGTLSGVGRPRASQTHQFVPQVPDLPLFGAFRANPWGDGRTAINSYINQYLIGRGCLAPGSDGFIEAEYGVLRDRQSRAPDPLIVTIFGYASNDGRIFDSVSFKIECAVARAVNHVKDRIQGGCLLLYVPHPLHRPSILRRGIPVDGVTLCESSVSSWLLSDVCVSLSSSAMFEAASFGIRAFTPMVAQDGIFTERYLDLVSHPKSGSFDEFASDLQECLVASGRVPRVDVVERARARLELMR